jgi:hypothetical protein
VGRHTPRLTDTKNQKKGLDMICRPDKNAVIQRNYHVMNTKRAVLPPQIRGRSRLFRSLVVAVAGALIFMGFTTPRVDAVVVSYFNFEDAPSGQPMTPCATVDCAPDFAPANPGGGVEPTTSTLTIIDPGLVASTPGLLANRTPGDSDTADPGLGVNFSRSSKGDASISFSVNLKLYQGLSLSFATNNNGNGYGTVTLGWVIDSGCSVNCTGSLSQAMPTAGTQIVTFDLTGQTALNGDGVNNKMVTFTLTFSNGQSNGVDLQTVIDNIRLDAAFAFPEPKTVWGGLLGVLGLCWHQRRRLVRFLRLRPA